MTGLRVYTVLDATLPDRIALDGQARLWVVAVSKREARALVAERGVTFREPTFTGPVAAGPFVDSMRRCALLDEPAVFAYPVPHEPGTKVLRVDSLRSTTAVATMGDVLGAGVR
jgi:hypothetical protein